MTFLTKLMALFGRAPHAPTATPAVPSEHSVTVDTPPAAADAPSTDHD
jgi:hypothetical protein